jgi:hypothetical protein
MTDQESYSNGKPESNIGKNAESDRNRRMNHSQFGTNTGNVQAENRHVPVDLCWL